MKKILFSLVFFVFLASPIILRADAHILGPADFNPRFYNTTYQKFYNSIYPIDDTAGVGFFAPVHLPQNARVTSVVVFYADFEASYDVIVSLVKTNAYTENSATMAEFQSSGTPGITTHKIAPITGGNRIDNNGYSYCVDLLFTGAAGSNLRLFKVKINYK